MKRALLTSITNQLESLEEEQLLEVLNKVHLLKEVAERRAVDPKFEALQEIRDALNKGYTF